MFICHLSLTRGWTNDRSTWLVNNKLKPIINWICLIFQPHIVPYSFLFLFILLRITLSEWECFEMHITRRQSRFVFSEIANLLHLEYFVFWAQPSEHTIHLLYVYPFSVFSTQPPPQIRVVNAFRQAQQQQGSANSNLQVIEGFIFRMIKQEMQILCFLKFR